MPLFVFILPRGLNTGMAKTETILRTSTSTINTYAFYTKVAGTMQRR